MRPNEKVPSLVVGLVLALFVTLMAITACGPADTDSSEPAPDAESAEATDPPTAEPEQTTDWVGDVSLGTDVAADGTIPDDAATDRVPVGETAFVSVTAIEPPAGAQLRVTFLGPDGQVVAEDGKRVSPEGGALFVSSGPTVEWAAGSYRVEVWVGSERVAERTFELVEGV